MLLSCQDYDKYTDFHGGFVKHWCITILGKGVHLIQRDVGYNSDRIVKHAVIMGICT